jgi:hypothetical protein
MGPDTAHARLVKEPPPTGALVRAKPVAARPIATPAQGLNITDGITAAKWLGKKSLPNIYNLRHVVWLEKPRCPAAGAAPTVVEYHFTELSRCKTTTKPGLSRASVALKGGQVDPPF